MPKMEDYLICMRNQTDRFELELLECDELLNHHPAGLYSHENTFKMCTFNIILLANN